ncbi:SDR family oxidoreductase [Mycobacterium simiae]|uniref:3-oxoacyl-[acyl-carrier-protein] reductase MabA n=1 Tax=Mycobacterium simiae TaxID=1784 RepID=A0A5B1BN15_MYCSI|nr:SDR family oxidoreductase [Mycobacterium simiae]KAA1250017.1 SDR family oxidoreductase [Mycobacterium simiae]
MPPNPRHVLITGSTSGIGEAAALAFAHSGDTVYVNGRDQDRTAAAAERIRHAAGEYAGEIIAIAADIATADGAQQIFTAVPDLDVLVNNAGIFTETPPFEITDDEWRRHFEVNVLSGVRLTRHYAPRMAERGWGRVIFISSECGVTTPPEMIHYGMTKSAQLAVSRGFAIGVAGTGVTVNAVLPGPTRTPGAEDFVAKMYGGVPFEEAERRYFADIRPASLLQRFCLPSEVANLIHYVASDRASATTGAALRVDGGVIATIIP